MWQLPPIPPWDGLHPLVIHFPIVLTLLAPIFVFLSIFGKRMRWPMSLTATGLLIGGAAAAWVAVSTGEAAGELAMRTPAINQVMEVHESLAEFTAKWLTGLVIGFVLLQVVILCIRKYKHHRLVWVAACAVMLGCQVVGVLAVVNTAHNGGRLVHDFGVQALLPKEPLPTLPGETGEIDDD